MQNLHSSKSFSLNSSEEQMLEKVRIQQLRRKLKTAIPVPSTLKLNEWPPNHDLVKAWRQLQLERFEDDPDLLEDAKRHYADRPAQFINHWCTTYDPRNVAQGKPPKMPFVLFERQEIFLDFVLTCMRTEADGLVEKSRDMGATWVCCALSIWLWLFKDGAAVGWGSRKQELVDRIGDPSSIFEKMRILLREIPSIFLPKGFSFDGHAHYMRLVNPENGASIIGEIGDQIGRGGRTLVYFKDESAHYERAESIEAALMDNTRCQIDISSVSGTDTLFFRKRDTGVDWAPGNPVQKGKTNVFVLDWSDHPEKTPEWYKTRKAKAKNDGVSHLFAREVDRDYAASVEGVVIQPDWVKAALGADEDLGIDDSGGWASGLDVADEGPDSNAQTIRKGLVLKFLDEWSERDTGLTGRRAVSNAKELVGEDALEFEYDCIGVGAGVKAETNRLVERKKIPRNWDISPWSAGGAVLNPGERIFKVAPGEDPRKVPTNKDFFENIKAQAWWKVARRFENVYRLRYEDDFECDPSELIALPRSLSGPLLQKLMKELSQPVFVKSARLKMMIKKTPEGSKSPNIADSYVMAYWPAKKKPRLVSHAGVMAVSASTSIPLGTGKGYIG